MSTTCPFACGYKSDDGYALQFHIEEHHTENSPFITNDRPSLPKRTKFNDRLIDDIRPSESGAQRRESEWFKCTRPGCGEYVALFDVDEHLAIHESIATIDTDEQQSTTDSHSTSSRTTVTTKRHSESTRKKLTKHEPPKQSTGIMRYFMGTSSGSMPLLNPLKHHKPAGRLGPKDLGPHAFEKAMPANVRRDLENNARPRSENRIGIDGKLVRKMYVPNETPRLVPILADLSDLDHNIATAYYCDEHVKHVHKLSTDGNFCGFWNIQMLLTHIYAVSSRRENRELPLPNILRMQDTIEAAWNAGIGTHGRVETGGIRNTRKWIGTQEAAAYLQQIEHGVTALSFKSTKSSRDPPACVQLLDYIEAYFLSGRDAASRYGSSYVTELPPIYFQRAGHSMTIVGLERRVDGDRNLILFDPSFATSSGMLRLVDGKVAHARIETLMAAYRKDVGKLEHWDEFEILIPQAQDESGVR
ncbi:hypothetical protein B0A48_13341 [Cryoendolithus antarcticus]|uniref:UFSP1/2/DUB catalytic domain-containing protein n=1 Tax=Cryoendolithus antarcticus TaxID=1507870 RepID=A0A1V8SPZ4_9PEZI|nr:hypothetical protein B0A48_13341 [Cryoendolithus antarcticus]